MCFQSGHPWSRMTDLTGVPLATRGRLRAPLSVEVLLQLQTPSRRQGHPGTSVPGRRSLSGVLPQSRAVLLGTNSCIVITTWPPSGTVSVKDKQVPSPGVLATGTQQREAPSPSPAGPGPIINSLRPPKCVMIYFSHFLKF